MAGRRRTLARLALGVAGTQLGLAVGARSDVRIGPASVRLAVRLARDGGTTVHLPPAGSAQLATHAGPLRVDATLTAIDAEGIDLAALESGLPGLIAPLRAEAEQAVRRAGIRAAVAGLAGAAGLTALVRRRTGDVAVATAVSAATLAVAAVVARRTWQPQAWREPRLTGLLTKAPLVLGDLRTAPGRVSRYQEQLAELVETATAVYARLSDLPEPPPADAIRLLHVSDIHLNPVAFHLAQALVDRYRIDAVVDTGDLVDWGTPVERALPERAGRLSVPYVFVKGNHDSDLIAQAVAEQANGIVLDGGGEPVEVAGLRFVGLADPRFTPDKTTGDDDAPVERLSQAGRRLAEAVRAAGSAPDVALAHDPAAGRQLAGLVPLVLAGHTHRRAAAHLDGATLMLVQGSSGGAGLRGVQQAPPTPLCFTVLHLDRATRRLHTIDDVTVGGLGRVELSVARAPVARIEDGER